MKRRLQARQDDVVVQRARPEQEALLEGRHAALGLDLSLQATDRLGRAQICESVRAAANRARNCHSHRGLAEAPGGHAAPLRRAQIRPRSGETPYGAPRASTAALSTQSGWSFDKVPDELST